MSERVSAQAIQSIKDDKAIELGVFVFAPNLPISKKSRFGDEVWDWTDESKPRLRVTPKAKLRFDWGEITLDGQQHDPEHQSLSGNQLFLPMLPRAIVEDLKRAFFIAASFPGLLQGRGRRPRKAISLVLAIRLCTNFLSHLYSLPNNQNRLDKLSDITIADIQSAINTFPYRQQRLKTVLIWLTTESIQGNLKYGRLQWNLFDLKSLHLPPKKDRQHIATLPDRLFALLSNKSRELIGEFHHLLEKTPQDSDRAEAMTESPRSNWLRFREMLDSYVYRRQLIKTKGRWSVSNHTRFFVREFDISPRDVYEFLYEVQNAAFNVILLYTGMRYSEAGSLQVGCLVERDGLKLIKSSLIKAVPSDMPIDQDEWIAIDVVQDAVLALEEIARCTANRFLFANFDTVMNIDTASPLSDGGLSYRLNLFLRKIDADRKWNHWHLSLHQYRHGLIYQLVRAEVGLPYITRQLKHYHTLLSERSYKINQASTIYGMQKQMLVGSATGQRSFKDANVEMLEDIYGEGRRFAGGGAALHIERTEAFFRGNGLQGKPREKYIKKLAASGVAPIRTGVGWCVRNHVDPQKLKEAPPPCIGDLNCNPHTCVHSLVPEGRKSDVIARYRNAAKQLASPDQSHLTSHWQAELDAYSAMLQQLGVDPKSLPAAVISPDTISRVLAVD